MREEGEGKGRGRERKQKETERGEGGSHSFKVVVSLGSGPYPDGLVEVWRQGARVRVYVKLLSLGGGILGHSEVVCHEDL